MEHDDENQETPCFVPVIARIELLEEKSFSKSDACAVETRNECKTLSSALEEVHHKGTLMERLALLEKRVLELSLEIDEGNSTSRSTSSTVQTRKTISKTDSELGYKEENGYTINKQQTAQEKASPSDGSVKEIYRSRGQKTKSQKRWPWLCRHTC